MKASVFNFLKIAAQLLVALFAIDSLLIHFRSASSLSGPASLTRGQPQTQSRTQEENAQLGFPTNPAGQDANKDANGEQGVVIVTTTVISPSLVSTTTILATSTVVAGGSSSGSGSTAHLTTYGWVSEDEDGEEILHFSIERPYPNPRAVPEQSVLTLAITRDNESYGRNPAEEPRTIYNFLDFATNHTLEPQQCSLAILTASEVEFESFKAILSPDHANTSPDSNTKPFEFAFHRVTLIYHPGGTRAPKASEKKKAQAAAAANGGSGSVRADRHNVPQHERRATLAKLRNYLMNVALRSETHVLWLDADVYKFSSNKMVAAMMNRTRTTDDADVGVLTARCRMGEPDIAEAWMAAHPDFVLPEHARTEEEEERRGKEGGRYEVMAWKTRGMGHYDLNAWKGMRVGPNNVQQQGLWKDIASWTPGGGPGMKILDGLIEKLNDSEIAQLDSVGGTVLMLRADLVRMGLNFAMGYFVGMTFEHGEGFDGIETEGVCLLSRSMSRDGQSMCYTMGGDWSVWHTVF